MKLKNETKYRSDDLRKLLRLALKAVGVKGKKLTVTVGYAQRHGHVTGYAFYGHQQAYKDDDGLTRHGPLTEGSRMRLKLPADPARLDLAELCWVAMHEAQHLLNIRHGEMTPAMRKCYKQPLPAWADGLQVRTVEPEATVPMTPEQRQERARTAVEKAAALREARARAAHDKWLKAEKHAATMRRKWAKKVRYYDQRAAAKRSG